MDKAAIKTFAINSRRKLMEDVEYRMSLVGITRDGIQDSISDADGIQTFDIGGSTYSIYDEDIKKRENLVKEVNNKGFVNVIEEVAYTWFNRIIAIRYMEVNDYLPTKTRVLSSETPGKTEPDIITNAFDLDLDYGDDDRQQIFKLKDENQLDELFRFLFIKQCNKLNEILPGLFEKTEDYMELLLNISFVSEEGVVRNLVDKIPEEDFTNQVEIIGWLYQFYNTELKDETFANLKKRIKISKEHVPAATQLFTPDWIVKYMVENSVGRLWLEGHPNDELKSNWKYYIEDAQQDHEVGLKLSQIRNESKDLMLEDMKVIDPCMGSGHILVYVFDILMQIYVSEGYTEKDAAENILENNLYGLDIDDRAYQLSYFAVMMKARSYNKRIFSKNIFPSVSSIKESNNISKDLIDFIISENPSIENDLIYILSIFKDSKEYGSILNVNDCDFEKIRITLKNIKNMTSSDILLLKHKEDIKFLENILEDAILLNNKYDIVITNPPYMSSKGMSDKLKNFLKNNYNNSKADLFAVFIEKCQKMLKKNAFLAMITQHVFMYLTSFEKLRIELLKNTIVNMAHLGPRAFEDIGGEVVQATSFVLRNINLLNYKSTFIRLVEYNSQNLKEKEFFNVKNKYVFSLNNLDKIPGSPIVYNANKKIIELFKNKTFDNFSEPKSGIMTGRDPLFIRYWFEVSSSNISYSCSNHNDMLSSGCKWFPITRGGEYRKWYGNLESVVNLENDGYAIQNLKNNNYRLRDSQYYFKKGLTWTGITSNLSVRYVPKGVLFGSGGPTCFIEENLYYFMGLLNSVIAAEIISFLNPTLNIVLKDISSIPIIEKYDKLIDQLVKENIILTKKNWDFKETSWDFEKHIFLSFFNKELKLSYKDFIEYQKNSFKTLKNNEEKLNQLFLGIYEVEDVLSYEVDESSLSLDKFSYSDLVISFISYAVGCMFGRYSLERYGLVFAGGTFDLDNYSKFIPDDDNIIPVLDTEYFDDDIIGRFVEFVRVCFGEETLEENLDFIAGALKKRGKTSREIIRNYFLNDFFKDHAKTYKKCPIYWEFSSGKENGFNCLVYMHRYEPGLVARVRTDYLHKTQKAIELNIANCDNIINNSSVASEITKATKEKNKLIKQLEETREYDEALSYIANQNIEIDLDDGVKVNYAKFQNVEVSKEGQSTKKINLLKKI